MTSNNTLTVLVDGMNRQGDGNLSVTLVMPAGGELPTFKAGAHIDVHLREGLVRQYSIASSPSRRDVYVICVRRSDISRGGSTHVHANLRVGDELQISYPRNLFEIRPARRHLLIAGGIGMTPLLSMAEALDEEGTPFEFHYYVSRRNDVAFAQRLYLGFAHGPIWIHSKDEGRCTKSFLPEALYAPDDDTQLYLCGPSEFMNAVTDTAVLNGWSSARIHTEAFGATPTAAHRSAESNLASDYFEVRLTSSSRTFKVFSHETIADVLLDAGLNVPVSCGVGVCGACLTTVVSGSVDHRDSVQSDNEKCSARQSIALCCSRSTSPLLVIDL